MGIMLLRARLSFGESWGSNNRRLGFGIRDPILNNPRESARSVPRFALVLTAVVTCRRWSSEMPSLSSWEGEGARRLCLASSSTMAHILMQSDVHYRVTGKRQICSAAYAPGGAKLAQNSLLQESPSLEEISVQPAVMECRFLRDKGAPRVLRGKWSCRNLGSSPHGRPRNRPLVRGMEKTLPQFITLEDARGCGCVSSKASTAQKVEGR